jgi:trans-2,3-dihydro-3-hydroxyanthranilate isomerase
MENRIFAIVDVFAEKKYSGNQLGVFRNVGSMSSTEMQQIAKEMNYSETTFILSEEEREGGFDTRIFTPEEELPFAGHPTLGTAFVIQQDILKKSVERVVLNLGIGQISVSFSYKDGQPDLLWMKQKPPVFGKTIDRKSMARCLNLDEEALDSNFPVQEVSTGVPFLIVPLKSLDYLKEARVSMEHFSVLIQDSQAKSPLVFCPESRHEQNDLSVRVFADYYGIPEDPATGSANGCLAGYLVKHRYFGKDQIDVRAEQGHEIGRPSLLFLKAQNASRAIEVFVGGRCVMVARGEFV